MLEMKKVRSKKLFGDLVTELRPFMNADGIEVLDYFGDEENINAFKLGELKEDLTKSMKPELFTNLEDFLDVTQNLGIKVKDLEEATVEEIEAKETPKKDTKKSKKEAKNTKKETKKDTPKVEAKKEVTEEQIVKLVGYRYTRPEFPQTLKSAMLGEYTLERVDEEKLDKLEEMDIDNLIVATFYAPHDSGQYVDPENVLDVEYTKKLQAKGLDSFPNNLDLGQVYYLNSEDKVMVHISLFTGIPYTVSMRPKWAKVDKTLHCRVNNFGHDYAIYKAVKK